jgi:hypothetical protein
MRGHSGRRLGTEGVKAVKTEPSTGGRGVFVGRERELGELRQGLTEARAGRGGMFLVVGEPGIGKTRLADVFCAEAHAAAAHVLWGRCWEAGGAPAYWPWFEVLRAYARTLDESMLAAQMGAGAPHLARILPVAARLASPRDLATLKQRDPEQARLALFDAVASFLASAAAERPVVLVLDDVHVADRPSLLLLQYLVQRVRETRVLVVATCREAEADLGPAARDAIGALARDGRTLTLRGLAEGEVAEMLTLAIAGEVPAAVAATVHAAADGNAFFADEIIRLLRAEGRLNIAGLSEPLPVPEGVRGAVRSRLAALGDETRDLLAAGSVIGREFSVEVLAHVCDTTLAAVAELLAPATAARIMLPPSRLPGSHRFSHVLYRQVLYDDLSPVRRAALHVRIGETLEDLPATRRQPAEVAHHFLAALPHGDAARALTWASRAGDHAAQLLAHEEAAAQYEGALRALELAAPGEHERRCDLLLALGEARLWAGETTEARSAFQRAAKVARTARLPERLARAALGYGRIVVVVGVSDEPLIALLREALAALPQGDSALRVRLLGRLARELHFAPDSAEREALSLEGVAMARRLGDPATVASALGARHVAVWAPDTLDERLATVDEMLRLGAAAGDQRLLFDAQVWRASDLLEAGDVAGADAAMQACRALEEDAHTPAWSWQLAVYDGTRALLDGRFDDAEQLIRRAAELGERAKGAAARRYFAIQSFMLGRERGTLAEMAEVVRRSFVDLYDRPARLAQLAAELGRAEEARAELEHAPAGALTVHRRNILELPELTCLVPPCALLADTERAAAVYARLMAHVDRIVVRGIVGFCDGSVNRYLGVLATVLERWQDGEQHFRSALECNARLGSPPLVARTRVQYAELLLTRDAAGDRQLAAELLQPALAAARELGMHSLERRADELLAQTVGVTWVTTAGDQRGLLRREGEVWAIERAGVVVRMRDSKGMRYLARLLENPGLEVAARELAAAAPADPPLTREGLEPRGATDDDAGPFLDTEAKAAYRQRLADLDEELDEAERWHDAERAARSRIEIEALRRELAAAVGLGGRDRRVAASAERARISVSKAIRRAVRHIGEHDPELGEHLTKAIRTGTFCAYTPDARAAIRWTVVRGARNSRPMA